MPEEDAPEKLKRERAGTYRTSDGRFTVEQTSSGWLVMDAEETNELGLPLTRGPFGTLDEARTAISGARTAPAPQPEVRAVRARSVDRSDADKAEGSESAKGRTSKARPAARPRPAAKARPARPSTPPVVIRELRAVDGDDLRELWQACGFRSLGDDDLSLARMARRNPGLLLVASEGTRVVASALGAWDGRRGWIYHVATAESHRRQGIATRLVDRVETALRDLGCPKVSALVRDANEDGRAFWAARRYEEGSRQFARDLRED